jgi:hypothetical protein
VILELRELVQAGLQVGILEFVKVLELLVQLKGLELALLLAGLLGMVKVSDLLGCLAVVTA